MMKALVTSDHRMVSFALIQVVTMEAAKNVADSIVSVCKHVTYCEREEELGNDIRC